MTFLRPELRLGCYLLTLSPMSDLEHPNANRPYPTGRNRCILSEASPEVEAARAELLASLPIPNSLPDPQQESLPPPGPLRPLTSVERPRPPTRTRKEGLPRAPTDDQLLNALDGFATLILSGADLPHEVCSLSLNDILAELGRRGERVTRAGRLMALAGQMERLAQTAAREARFEKPTTPALDLRARLADLREGLVVRLEKLLRRAT